MSDDQDDEWVEFIGDESESDPDPDPEDHEIIDGQNDSD